MFVSSLTSNDSNAWGFRFYDSVHALQTGTEVNANMREYLTGLENLFGATSTDKGLKFRISLTVREHFN